ncbi:MAG: DUF4231 domain-containing protein [Elusimicrobia bacterium]|nr:DUF4231 domain-containing protein [Elusimicrobiota bacterium]
MEKEAPPPNGELKLSVNPDADDPGVFHLTADRDMGGQNAVQPLMQKILNLPGINGVRRENARTLIVEKTDVEDWQAAAKTIEELFKDHFKGNGDARQKGPKGHTRFGATLENLWYCFRQLDRLAVKVKAEVGRDRKRALWALALTSVIGLLCSEKVGGRAFGLLALPAAAASAFFTRRSATPEKEFQWVRARALAEDAKSEAIKFMVRCDPYDKEDAVARLAEKAAHVRQCMAEIGEFEDMDKAQRLVGLPKDWYSMDDYLLDRVKDQSDWYGRKSRQNRQEAEKLMRVVMAFTVAAGVLGVTPLLVGDLPPGSPLDPFSKDAWDAFPATLEGWGLAGAAASVKAGDALTINAIRFFKLLGSTAWISVLSTLTGAITTFQAQNKLEFVSLQYKQTRARLEAALAEWTDQVKPADKPGRQSEFVVRFEQILNQEHAAWNQEFNQGAPPGMAGGATTPIL